MTAGIYSTIRHPHNLACALLNFGIAFIFKSIIGLIIAIASIVLGYWLTLEEEKLLIKQFGDRYRDYRIKVPMFIPRLRKKS
jgi:protein-S-isoprenylcysteine O-methyltransferase Ste14